MTKLKSVPFSLKLAKKGESFYNSTDNVHIEMFYVSGNDDEFLFKFKHDGTWHYGNSSLCNEETKNYYHLI